MKKAGTVKAFLKDKNIVEYLCWYTFNVIEGRWPEAESYIMKDAEWAYEYACNVMKNERWLEAEPVIMKNAKWAYWYARYVINGRWPEAEPFIMKDAEWAYVYAKYVIEDRWPEAEPVIMKDAKWADRYCWYFGITEEEMNSGS